MTEALAIPEADLAKPEPLVPFAAMHPERKALMRQICRAEESRSASGKVTRALTDGEMSMLCEVGIRSGLDPFQKQIYGIILKGQFTIVTGIGGFRAVARRNGLAGVDAPKFAWADEHKRIPYACEITAYRWGPPAADGTRQKESYTGRCLFHEFRGDSPIWSAKPAHMLAIRTEAHTLRMAFTETLGGLYEVSEIEAERSPGRAAQVTSGPVSARALLASETPTETVHEATVEGDPDAAFYESDKGPP